MAIIQKLSKQMANLIAAGEVVERPASVAKELIENSIDAGATLITVEIEAGGISLLRVTDNGTGIAPDDAETAFLRHATSKISSEEDLFGISTMGFRGEALAAIAAVADVTMYTKPRDCEIGTEIRVQGGTVVYHGEAGCPNGTSVSVRELFYNTPARHKFLKKDATEAGYIESVCQRAAMAHPEISFKLVRDGTVGLQTPGDGELYSALYCMFGREFARKLTEIAYDADDCSLRGYVSLPEAARGSRSMQFFSVNTRPVKNTTIQSALEEACRKSLVSGRFPCAFLNISMPPEKVDVNVHPAKTEVKFSEERRIFELVYYGVRKALEPSVLEQTQPEAPEPERITEPAENITACQPMTPESSDIYKMNINSTTKSDIINNEVITGQLQSHHLPDTVLLRSNSPAFVLCEEPEETDKPATDEQPVPPAAPEFRYIGEAMGVYLIFEKEDSICLLDKHAAHERIRYNELVAGKGSVTSQELLSPAAVTLLPHERAILLENTSLLAEAGFNIEDFGGGSIVLRALPSLCADDDPSVLLSEAAEQLSSRGGVADTRRDKLFKMMACKSAERAGDAITEREAEALIKRVLTDETVRYCPHGRPVMVSMTKSELEKRFSRTV